MRFLFTPLKLVAIAMLLIGISLVSSFNDVKESANEMTETVFAPINAMLDSPTNLNALSNFDSDKYQQEAFAKVGEFTWDWISFERDVTVGVSAIALGLGLFVTFSIVDERRFWEKAVEFFF